MSSLTIYYNLKCNTENQKFVVSKIYAENSSDINNVSLNNICPNNVAHECDNNYFSIIKQIPVIPNNLNPNMTYTNDDLRDKIIEIINFINTKCNIE